MVPPYYIFSTDQIFYLLNRDSEKKVLVMEIVKCGLKRKSISASFDIVRFAHFIGILLLVWVI